MERCNSARSAGVLGRSKRFLLKPRLGEKSMDWISDSNGLMWPNVPMFFHTNMSCMIATYCNNGVYFHVAKHISQNVVFEEGDLLDSDALGAHFLPHPLGRSWSDEVGTGLLGAAGWKRPVESEVTQHFQTLLLLGGRGQWCHFDFLHRRHALAGWEFAEV